MRLHGSLTGHSFENLTDRERELANFPQVAVSGCFR